jgi:hypothetical protein
MVGEQRRGREGEGTVLAQPYLQFIQRDMAEFVVKRTVLEQPYLPFSTISTIVLVHLRRVHEEGEKEEESILPYRSSLQPIVVLVRSHQQDLERFTCWRHCQWVRG